MTDSPGFGRVIRDYWSQITLIGFLLLTLAGAVIEMRIRANVSAALAAMDLSTDDNINAIKDSIDKNTDGVDDNADGIVGLERRVELAFAALMRTEPPPPRDP